MTKLIRTSLAAAIIFAASQALGQSTTVPCQTAAYREFDFFLGSWNVRGANGQTGAISRIENDYGNCVIIERYDNGQGYRGTSLNVYDALRKVWHQTWVDNQGGLLVLEGGKRGEEMILEGSTTGSDGKVTRHRITWTPNADGSVRQHWESADSTGVWKNVFDGRYTKATAGNQD